MEDETDVPLCFNRPAIQQGRRIKPLANGAPCRFQQQRRAAHELDAANGAVLAYGYVKFDGSFDSLFLCKQRIDGIDAVNQHTLLQGCGGVFQLLGWRRWRRRQGTRIS